MSLDQRIVYAALSRMTKDKMLIQSAFQYWQANLSDKAFDVVEVTSGIESFLGLSDQEKKVLMIALHAASNKTETELAVVPAMILQKSPEPVVDEVSFGQLDKVISSHTPHYYITSQFIVMLIDATRKVGVVSVSEMDDILRDEGLPDLAKKDNKLIRQHGFSSDMVDMKIDSETCRELAHAIYMLLIEVIGPMQADLAVNQAIDKLLGSDMAGRFDPRSLI